MVKYFDMYIVPYNHFSKEKTEKQAELLFVTFRQI